jgi:PAS domain S-box-containing protein
MDRTGPHAGLVIARAAGSGTPYLIALASVALALGFRVAMDPWLGQRQTLTTLYLAVAVTAWFGGMRPSLVALAIGLVGADQLLVEPRGTFSLLHPRSHDWASAVLFTGVGLMIAALSVSLRRARDRARLEAHDLDAVLRNTPFMLARCSRDLRYLYVSHAYAEMIGCRQDEIAGRPILQVLGIEGFEQIHPHVQKVLGGESVEYDADIDIAGRGRRSLHARYTPERNERGDVTGWIASILDLSERRRSEMEREGLLQLAERARADAERRLLDVQALVAVNRDLARTPELDELLPKLCGLVRSVVGADGATFVLREGERVRYVAEDAIAPLWAGQSFPIGACIAGQAILSRQTVVVDDVFADERVPIDVYRATFVRSLVMVPLRRDAEFVGAMGAYWATARAPTAREVALLEAVVGAASAAVANARLIGDLRAAHDSLQAENRAKDEFLAMLGHELRNPLAAVRNAVVAAAHDPARSARALEIARRQSDQLGRLIDDLVDVARITQGRISLRKEPVDPAEILVRAVESTRSLIEAHGVTLHLELGGERTCVEADPARLEQVFVNVLSNAAKYTDAGGRIDALLQRRGGEVDVRVRDTGIGIAPEVLPRIWELFAQGDRALDRAPGGLGIGLTVARRLVELHGGRIDAASEGLGKGAEFVVSLPAVAVDAGARDRAALSVADERAADVLIVEDNPDTAESLAMLLQLRGHRTRAVPDGQAALDAARAARPDAMLVDIGLPGIDGYAVASLVRSDPALSGVLLLALTGYGREEDKRLARAAGFDHHLVKPVDPEELFRLLARAARAPSEPAQPSA